MRTHPKTPAVPTRHQAALDEILKYPGARAAFEGLCAEGLDRQRLMARVLCIRSVVPSRMRRLFVDRSKCRQLSIKMAALADELKDRDIMGWCRVRRKPHVTSKVEPPILVDFSSKPVRGRSEHLDPKPLQSEPHEDFDARILCEQLRAGARELQELGNTPNPIVYAFRTNDIYLWQLVDDVKNYTGKNHYKEIALLCEAATSGRQCFDPDALKQRAHRLRSSRKKTSRVT